MRPALPCLLALTACGESEADVAAAMTEALRAANVALGAALVADEVLGHTLETPDTELRHGSSECGCPCASRTGAPPGSFVLTLDYHDAGCVPDSGLVGGVLSGSTVVEGEGLVGETRFDGLALSFEHGLSGSVAATLDAAAGREDLSGDFTLGAHATELDVAVVAGDPVTVDGEIVAGGLWVTFDRIGVPRDRLGAPCPTPTTGRLTILGADGETVEVDPSVPGRGSVTVTRGRRVSEAVSWCAFRSDLF